MPKIINTAGVIIFKNDKVLLVCHNKNAGHLTNTYGLPAGHIEPQETAIETAIRELKEETDLITTKDSLEKINKTYQATIERKDGLKTFSQTNFICTNYQGNLKATLETTPAWVKIKNLDKLNLLPNVKKMILDAI